MSKWVSRKAVLVWGQSALVLGAFFAFVPPSQMLGSKWW